VLGFSSDLKENPSKLVINVVLPGKGTVWLSALRLRQHDPGEDTLRAEGPSAWWSDRTGGLIGGLGGTIFGCLAALVGVLGGLGKARRLVTSLLAACCLFGVAGLAVGVAALASGQPYGVYYPLLLGGGILSVICGVLIPVLLRRYAELELRKIQAMDAG